MNELELYTEKIHTLSPNVNVYINPGLVNNFLITYYNNLNIFFEVHILASIAKNGINLVEKDTFVYICFRLFYRSAFFSSRYPPY